MSEFTLTPATEADAPLIRELIHQVGINPMGLDWRRFIVARSADGQFAGCGQIKTHSDSSSELASIAIVPHFRKQGLARRIILHLLETAPRPLYLTCRANLGTFYTKFGFSAISREEMPRYFRRIVGLARVIHALGVVPEPILVMRLD